MQLRLKSLYGLRQKICRLINGLWAIELVSVALLGGMTTFSIKGIYNLHIPNKFGRSLTQTFSVSGGNEYGQNMYCRGPSEICCGFLAAHYPFWVLPFLIGLSSGLGESSRHRKLAWGEAVTCHPPGQFLLLLPVSHFLLRLLKTSTDSLKCT